MDKYGYPRECFHCGERIKHDAYAVFRALILDGEWVKRSWHTECFSGR